MTFQKLKKSLFLIGVLVFSLLSLGGAEAYKSIPPSLKVEVYKVKIKVPVPPKIINDQYLTHLHTLARDNNVPILLVYKLIDRESRWRQSAVGYNKNSKGEVISYDIGMCQLNSRYVPWMIKTFGNKNKKYDVAKNAYHNAEIGVRYLAYLYDRFQDWKLAVMAYNCGPVPVMDGTIPLKTLQYGNDIVPVDGWWSEPENVELVS